jgi:hypothetical protein
MSNSPDGCGVEWSASGFTASQNSLTRAGGEHFLQVSRYLALLNINNSVIYQ